MAQEEQLPLKLCSGGIGERHYSLATSLACSFLQKRK